MVPVIAAGAALFAGGSTVGAAGAAAAGAAAVAGGIAVKKAMSSSPQHKRVKYLRLKSLPISVRKFRTRRVKCADEKERIV